MAGKGVDGATAVCAAQDGSDVAVHRAKFDWTPRELRARGQRGDRFDIALDGELGTISVWLRLAKDSDDESDSEVVGFAYSYFLGYALKEIPKGVIRILWGVSRPERMLSQEMDQVLVDSERSRRRELNLSLERKFDFKMDFEEKAGNVLFSKKDLLGKPLVAVFEIHVEKTQREAHLYRGFQELHSSNCLTDVTLVCRGTEFPCHRTVLAAFSPVFRAMLTGQGFKESREGRICINDFSQEVLQAAIKFLYTHNQDSIGKHAPKLLVFADMYDIEDLHTTCESLLAKSLSKKNAIAMLKLASKTNAQILKASVVKFLKSNWADFRDDASLKGLLQGDAKLATELLFSFNQLD